MRTTSRDFDDWTGFRVALHEHPRWAQRCAIDSRPGFRCLKARTAHGWSPDSTKRQSWPKNQVVSWRRRQDTNHSTRPTSNYRGRFRCGRIEEDWSIEIAEHEVSTGLPAMHFVVLQSLRPHFDAWHRFVEMPSEMLFHACDYKVNECYRAILRALNADLLNLLAARSFLYADSKILGSLSSNVCRRHEAQQQETSLSPIPSEPHRRTRTVACAPIPLSIDIYPFALEIRSSKLDFAHQLLVGLRNIIEGEDAPSELEQKV